MKFMVLVQCSEARDFSGNLCMAEGQWCRVDVGEDGGAVAVPLPVDLKMDTRGVPMSQVTVPKSTKLFDTVTEGQMFGRQWRGNVWWCKPNGTYSVVCVRPVYRQVLDRYELMLRGR